MKKNIYIISILILLTCTIALASCNGNDGKIVTEAPVPTITASTISWEKVANAVGYRVRCIISDTDSYTLLVNENSYTFSHKNAGDYIYQVAAVDAKGNSSAFSEAITYHVGTGTRNDPILIRSKADLESIKSGLLTDKDSKNVKDENGNVIPLFYLQINDVDLEGAEWTPIGLVSGSSNSFGGIYNGNGYKISNYKQSKVGAGSWTGFFAEINRGSVINLTLSDVTLNITKMTSAQDVGILCGGLTEGYLENCHVVGSLVAKAENDSAKLLSCGMLVGKMKNSVITRCSSKGNMDVKYGRVYAGGIVGYVSQTNSKDTILNCYSSADVTVLACKNAVTTPPVAYAGGIAGYVNTVKQFANCFCVGALKAVLPTGTETPIIKRGLGIAGSTYGATDISRNVFRSYVDVVSCYIDKETSGAEYALGVMQTPSSNSSVSVYTTTEMKNEQSYVDWDFKNIWQLEQGNYPVLRSYKAEFPATAGNVD